MKSRTEKRTDVRTKSPSETERDTGPRLGALLRLVHAAFVRDLFAGLARAGFDDVNPGHGVVTQVLWDRPSGVRASEIAERARTTKQSIAEQINDLKAKGYVEQVDDPDDGRAKIVRFTERGWTFAKELRRGLHRVEREWARRVGADRLASVHETLAMLNESLGD